MFSLIITIISIALVAALAIASIYYGGATFTSGKSNAAAAQYMTESAQIEGALALYKNDNGGSVPTSVSGLTPQYLRAVPSGDWSFYDDYYATSVPSESVCLAANKNAELDLETVPSCSDPAIDGYKSVCCAL
jgi:hypothetical protein